MNTKGAMIALLLVGGLVAWFLREDEQPTPPADSTTPPAARQTYRAPPGQAPAPAPSFDYPLPVPPQPYANRPQSAPFDRPPVDSYSTSTWADRDADAYRFRPLNDTDRRRMVVPETPQRHSVAPRTAPRNFPAVPWAQGEYRFRPYTPRSGEDSRYQPSDTGYPWETEPDYAERWGRPAETAPPPQHQPTWQPPSRMMLPSLDWPSDRTLTAR
jgi:hypothetical protein